MTAVPPIDWSAVRIEVVRHLQTLIAFDTTNPPGNEAACARYLAEVLAAEGIESRMLEPAPGRAILLATLRGDASGGGAVMLLAHMDVVGVDRAGWTVDPFRGELRDGYVYGRGAIDDKGMLAANLVATLLLKRNVIDAGGRLSRDVIFLATADEETGGAFGMAWLAANHPELLQAQFAINEGGRTRVVSKDVRYLAIQTAEKLSHVVRIVAHGPPGHAAVPLRDNAILRLGRALAALAAHEEPVRLTETTRQFFGGLAPIWPDRAQGEAMRDVVSADAERVRRGGAVLAAMPLLDAVLRAGISPTVVQGGAQLNVIPAEASAVLNVRTLPGQPLEEIVTRLQAAIGDEGVAVEVTHHPDDVAASDVGSPLFAALADAARTLDPAMVVVPYQSNGATDSARLRALGVQAYGVLPFPMSPEDEERMHGHDERVAVESLLFGTRLLFDALHRVAVR